MPLTLSTFSFFLISCCAECDKQVEKLKTATAKLPHLPVRVAADAGSIPLSRGSRARTVSFGSHFVSSQVKITLHKIVFFILLSMNKFLLEAKKGSF